MENPVARQKAPLAAFFSCVEDCLQKSFDTQRKEFLKSVKAHRVDDKGEIIGFVGDSE